MPRSLPALAVLLVLAAIGRTDEATELRDRVLKAAAKDPADIQKFKMFTLKAKGVSRVNSEATPATFELTAVYPSKLKATWEFSGDTKTAVTICGSDDRGWRKAAGFDAGDLPSEELNDFRNDTYGVFASTLIVLTGPETKLTLGPKSKVGGDAVVGLKLTRRPYPEITLYFDETTNLIRKMAYKSRENGVLLGKEMVFGGHKLVGGMMLPTTQTTLVQGREVYSWTDIQFTFPDKLPGETFDKPR